MLLPLEEDDTVASLLSHKQNNGKTRELETFSLEKKRKEENTRIDCPMATPQPVPGDHPSSSVLGLLHNG